MSATIQGRRAGADRDRDEELVLLGRWRDVGDQRARDQFTSAMTPRGRDRAVATAPPGACVRAPDAPAPRPRCERRPRCVDGRSCRSV
jgi:hypothetical protein